MEKRSKTKWTKIVMIMTCQEKKTYTIHKKSNQDRMQVAQAVLKKNDNEMTEEFPMGISDDIAMI